MKRHKNTYSIIGSLVVVAIIIVFSIYITKCHGYSCNSKLIMEEEKQVLLFPKMIPEIINKQVENNEIFLLDIRDDVEWNEGHIAGAKHITLDNLNIKTTISIPRDLPIYVYCRSGRRAIEAEFKLRALGFSKIENIGGIIHWKERGGMLTN